MNRIHVTVGPMKVKRFWNGKMVGGMFSTNRFSHVWLWRRYSITTERDVATLPTNCQCVWTTNVSWNGKMAGGMFTSSWFSDILDQLCPIMKTYSYIAIVAAPYGRSHGNIANFICWCNEDWKTAGKWKWWAECSRLLTIPYSSIFLYLFPWRVFWLNHTFRLLSFRLFMERNKSASAALKRCTLRSGFYQVLAMFADKYLRYHAAGAYRVCRVTIDTVYNFFFARRRGRKEMIGENRHGALGRINQWRVSERYTKAEVQILYQKYDTEK